MSHLVDQLKVWSATRNIDRGEVNYDRLANAGMLGEVVLHNMLHRMLDDTHYSSGPIEGHENVELRASGMKTYIRNRLMIDEAVGLFVSLEGSGDHAFSTGIVGANMFYSLANQAERSWKVYPTSTEDPARGIIIGSFKGPFQETKDQLVRDSSHAQSNPVGFVALTAERLINDEGMQPLVSMLGRGTIDESLAALSRA